MTAKVLTGRDAARRIREAVAEQVAQLSREGRRPHLVAVQVGENPASEMYLRMQAKACESAGIDHQVMTLAPSISQTELTGEIFALNADPTVTGIILQMPVPPQINARAAMNAIRPEKDVEAVNPANMGRLFYGGWHVAPCTPLAALELLGEVAPDLTGAEAVVIGHSEIVGKPMAMMLLAGRQGAPTVSICHIDTQDLAAHTTRADLLVVATGAAQAKWLAYSRAGVEGPLAPPDLSPLVGPEMVKPGAIVLDVAINNVPRGFDERGQPLLDERGVVDIVTVGDVDFEAVKEVASAITPVPGGVGPLTVAMLLRNVVTCARGGRDYSQPLH